MAQTGYTPIQLYFSSTTTNVPLAANLANGELAINITDGKLFYKDNAAAVQVIGWKTVPTSAGGTGLTSYTAGDMVYYASGTAFTKLGIGATDYVMTSSGSAPQWSQFVKAISGGTGQTSYAVGDLLYANTTTTLAKLADVATGNALISGGVGVAPSWGKIGLTTHVSGTLPTANGGTNLTSFTANGVVYASSTSALATGSNVTYNGSKFEVSAKESYFDPSATAGGRGLNIYGSYSYNNGTANTIGPLSNSFTLIHINSAAGFTTIPLFSNGGNGVNFAWTYLDIDAATWTYASAGATITFTQAGTGGNTFSIVLSSGGGSGTIQRTAGSQAYSVYVQLLAA